MRPRADSPPIATILEETVQSDGSDQSFDDIEIDYTYSAGGSITAGLKKVSLGTAGCRVHFRAWKNGASNINQSVSAKTCL